MAWLGIDLDGYYAHPLHSGWIGAFRRWAGSKTFQMYWPVLRGEYSKNFVRFCERVLNLPAITAVALPIRRPPAGLAGTAPWVGTMRRMNDEFINEWASVLSENDEYERTRGNRRNSCQYVPVKPDLVAAVEAAMVDDGEPLVWSLTLGKPPDRVTRSRRRRRSPREAG